MPAMYAIGSKPAWCDEESWATASAEYVRVVRDLRARNPDAPEGWLLDREQMAHELAVQYAVRLNGEAMAGR